MWFILAITAMLLWSGSDIFSKVGSKQDDKYSHFKMVIAVGFVMGLYSFGTILFGGVSITFKDILDYLPASALYILSMVIGYIGLRYIELSLSSPICNSSGAVTSIFLIIFFPAFILEGVSLVGLIIGVALCTIGVVGLGIVEANEDETMLIERQKDANRKYSKSFIAILLPLLYCLIDAGGTIADTFILEEMDEQVANVSYGLTFFAMGILAFIFVYVIKREKFSYKTEWAKGTGAICETLGQIAYIFAIAENAVVSAPIISCYCALSVIWGRIFLKEKLSFKHYLMIAITIIGIVVLGVFGG